MNRYLYPTFKRPPIKETLGGFAVGDRVRPTFSDERGTVVKIINEELVVKWDEFNNLSDWKPDKLTHE